MFFKRFLPTLFVLFSSGMLYGAVQQYLPSLPNACRPVALSPLDVDKDGVADLIVRCETFQGTLHYFYRGNSDSIFPNSPETKKHKQFGTWSYLPFYSAQGPIQDPGMKVSTEAKMRLNSDAIPDTVSVRYDGQIVIDLSTPDVTFTVNSTADPGNGVCDAGECTLREAINAANLTAAADMIAFNLPSAPFSIAPSTVLPSINQPLTIDGTTQPGYAGSPIVELNGTNLPGFFNGLTVNAASSLIRGMVINRFGASAINLTNSAGKIVEGSFLGTDFSGTVDLGNGACGVQISVPDCQIGSSLPSGRNVISGNLTGVCIVGQDSDNNKIFNNYIGTTADGTSDLGNSRWGISISQADNTIIGGSTSAVRNVISGNGDEGFPGILIGPDVFQTKIQGNFIGTNANGTSGLGNSVHGIAIFDSSQNTIGGINAGEGNVISGNTANGIQISGQSTNNEILGNFIGTDVNGTSIIANSTGISLGDASNTFIGANIPNAGNVICGNTSGGISIDGPTASGNQIWGNWIGTNPSGASGLGNGFQGIVITSGSQNTILSNVVAFNTTGGIIVSSPAATATGNLISKNSIYSNGAVFPPIDLGSDGVTVNDVGDADTGTNNLQNYPELTSLTADANSTIVEGTLNSEPNTSYTLEFFSSTACHGSAHGGGKTFFGTGTVLTDGTGNASFSFAFSALPAGESFVTATATNTLAKNTSEFSACLSNQAGLIFDDFEDSVLTWNIIKGNWGESSGYLIGFSGTKNSIYAPLPWPDSGVSGCTICTIETDVFTEGGQFGRVFIVGWFQDNKTKVELVQKEESDKWVLKEKVGGVVTNKAKGELQIQPNVLNHVVLSFDGTNYQVTVDGTLLITMPATATPFGNVGFRTKNTGAWFQQIFVQ